MKRIVLCADDYGQNSAISQAIIELMGKKRLTATSCLTTSPEWPKQAKLLQPFKEQVDFGLHFNLTEGKPLSDLFIKKYGACFLSVSKCIMRSYLRMLDPVVISAEFEAQLDQFEASLGQSPHFIDGHQHIHQLPVIREVITAVWKKRLQKKGVYVRCTDKVYSREKTASVKRLIIQLCGAKALKQGLIQSNIPHNASFEGIYDFLGDYSAIFPRFLEWVGDHGLIMCHPGLNNTESRDEIAMARYQEYRYFMSTAFLEDCQRADIKIVRFRELG